MKKALIIGALVLAAALAFFAFTNPSSFVSKDTATQDLTETAESLSAAEKEAPQEAMVMTRATEETVEAESTPAPENTMMRAVVEEEQAAAPDTMPTEPDVAYVMSERSMGDPNAPVTVIEYASLTCPHCANFSSKMLPEIKAKLVDTGRMRLVYRDFPLDAMAMKAAKMARCAPKDKFFDLIEVIFRNRDRWLAASIPEKSLMQYGVLSGMDEAYIRKCLDSEKLEEALAAAMQDAQEKFELKATPSFVFNYGAKVVSGEQTLAQFEEILAELNTGAAPTE